MRIHEENEFKINEYKRNLDRLHYELDYLKSEDKKGNFKLSYKK